MEGEQGPSKRVRYDTSQKKPLMTDEELLACLEKSDTEVDPFAKNSDEGQRERCYRD
jgi:hypothetical protein